MSATQQRIADIEQEMARTQKNKAVSGRRGSPRNHCIPPLIMGRWVSFNRTCMDQFVLLPRAKKEEPPPPPNPLPFFFDVLFCFPPSRRWPISALSRRSSPSSRGRRSRAR